MNSVKMDIGKLHPFEGHPFKVQDNEEMDALVESIQTQGILTPLIVRKKENTTDEYEIISGHRRYRAAMKAGLETVPAFIYALDRNAAAIMLVDCNLHRERLLPSEKAFAYKMKLDAMKRQGCRTDLTSDQVGPKLESAEMMALVADDMDWLLPSSSLRSISAMLSRISSCASRTRSTCMMTSPRSVSWFSCSCTNRMSEIYPAASMITSSSMASR